MRLCVDDEELSDTTKPSVVEMQTSILNPKFCIRSTVKRRVKFLLPRMDEMCTDHPSQERVGDVSVTSHWILDEAGVSREEELPPLTVNTYKLTVCIDAIYEVYNIDLPNKYMGVRTLYLTTSEHGNNPVYSITVVSEFVSEIFGIVT